MRGAVLLLLFLVPFHGMATAEPGPAPLVITSDITWTLQDVTVPGRLIVEAGATLRLEGTALRVGDQVEVRTGGSLVLGPSGDRATTLAPAGDQGFWMSVNGTLTSQGAPATDISGVRGVGLDELHAATGGIQIAGTADLADLHLHDGNATLIVREGGAARLRNAVVERMGFMALGAKGRLEVQDSFLNADHGIFGHKTCDIAISGTTIVGKGDGIMVNGCPLRLSDSRLLGSGNALSISADADVTLADVDIQGYTRHGMFVRSLPGSGAETLRPSLSLARVTMDPLGNGTPGAPTIGMMLQGIESATVTDSRITGNTGNGIQHLQGGPLRLTGSTVQKNGFFGLFAMMAALDGEPTSDRNDFGNLTAGTSNAKGAVYQRVQAAALVMEGRRALAGAGLAIHDASGATLVEVPAQDSYPTMVMVDTYRLDAADRSTYLGPFSYVLTHARLDAQEGALATDLEKIVIVANVEPAGGAWKGSVVIGTAVLGAAGVALLAFGLFGQRLRALVARRRT